MRALAPMLALALTACGRVGFTAPPGAGGVLTVAPLYEAAPDWNDWIQHGDPGLPRWAQAGLPCVGTEPGFGGCFHGGELRRAVTELTSCAGVEVRDALSAFQWTCLFEDSRAVLVSTGLRPGVGLRHLVDAAGWRDNAVEVLRGGTVFASSPPAPWWTNPVTAAPANEGAGSTTLTTPGTIYVVAGTAVTDGYVLGADGVGMVVLPGATLLGNPITNTNCFDSNDVTCMVAATDRRFLWLEGDLDARRIANYGVLFRGTRFSRLRGLRVASAILTDIDLWESSACALEDVVTMDAGSYGLSLAAARDNLVAGLTTAGNGRSVNPGYAGVLLEGAQANVLTEIVAAHNTPYGILATAGATSNVFVALTLASNDYNGVRLADPGNLLAQTLAASHSNAAGIQFLLSNRAAQVVTAHNDIGVQDDSPDHAFASTLVVGTNAMADCVLFEPTGYVFSCASLQPSVVVVPGVDLTSSLRTAGVGDDRENASDSAGAATSLDQISDWLRFESPSRAWGPDGPWPGTPGLCRDACRIWDWRRREGDTALVARDAAGAPSAEPVVAGAPCPSRLDGDHAAAGLDGTFFLLQARELRGDGRGDEDALCESGETCLDAPSLGAERDEPTSWTPEGCLFRDGLVAGVDLRGVE